MSDPLRPPLRLPPGACTCDVRTPSLAGSCQCDQIDDLPWELQQDVIVERMERGIAAGRALRDRLLADRNHARRAQRAVTDEGIARAKARIEAALVDAALGHVPPGTPEREREKMIDRQQNAWRTPGTEQDHEAWQPSQTKPSTISRRS
jgi:hypothetical protein